MMPGLQVCYVYLLTHTILLSLCFFLAVNLQENQFNTEDIRMIADAFGVTPEGVETTSIDYEDESDDGGRLASANVVRLLDIRGCLGSEPEIVDAVEKECAGRPFPSHASSLVISAARRWKWQEKDERFEIKFKLFFALSCSVG
jgi:hypothetical protein